MMGLDLSRRARLGLLAVFVVALFALFPMRLAFSILGLDRYGVSARSVTGSIWSGRIRQLSIGEVPLGTVRASLSPFNLIRARARIGIRRQASVADDLTGAMTIGFGRIGIDDVTGNLSLGATAAPLPVGGIDLTAVSAHFSGGACADAEGQVKARIAGVIPGLNLSQGLSGTATCDGPALLLPLVSQSGLEKMNVRLSADGRYQAEMRVTTSDPALTQGLQSQGFARSGDAFAIKVEGLL